MTLWAWFAWVLALGLAVRGGYVIGWHAGRIDLLHHDYAWPPDLPPAEVDADGIDSGAERVWPAGGGARRGQQSPPIRPIVTVSDRKPNPPPPSQRAR